MSQTNILIAEDSATQALHLRRLLQHGGYEVTTARNGLEALEILDNTFFPLVITDWLMPEMDGISFCRAVRKRPGNDYVYIILLTARGATEDMVNGLDAGADDYLVKPVDRAELFARLKTAQRILELQATLRKRNEELARMTVLDPLTGAYNRRYMTEYLPRTILQAARYRHPLSVVMCDIDHFKRVNDTYGHLLGDEALKMFATVLLGSIRQGGDWVVRYGGEEFLIVLPETGHDTAMVAAERYRERVAREEVRKAGTVLGITASFGVATLSQEALERGTPMEVLLGAADDCLYQAKKAGRNRTVGTVL